jgi:hypothetical protein
VSDSPIPFCPGCFATSEDGSANHVCDENYCYNCGSGGTVTIPRWAVESIRAQASWVGKRYYPNAEDHIINAELKLLRSRMPDHETDSWKIEDWAEYTDTPDVPKPKLTLKRRASKDSSRETSMDLPNPYTEEDVEAAKARLRVAIPVSWHYGLAEEAPQ